MLNQEKSNKVKKNPIASFFRKLEMNLSITFGGTDTKKPKEILSNNFNFK